MVNLARLKLSVNFQFLSVGFPKLFCVASKCNQLITRRFVLLDLTESEEDKGRFCPHFVHWSKSVAIWTIRLFHFCLTPQFLSVK